MHTLHLRKHELHIPSWHEDVMWMESLMKNERFWAVVALVALAAILVTLGILAGRGGGGGTTPISPIEPFYPYYYP